MPLQCYSWQCHSNLYILIIIIIISVQFISHSDFSLHTSVLSQFFKEKWGYYLHLANSNFTQCKPSLTQQQSTQRRKTVPSRRIWTISRGKLQNFVNWPPAEFGKLSALNCGPYLFTTASEVGSKLPRNNRKIWHKSWPHKSQLLQQALNSASKSICISFINSKAAAFEWVISKILTPIN